MDLIHNAALLLLIVYIYDLVSSRWRWQNLSLVNVPVGFALGLVGLAVMSSPLHMGEGVIYDTRSVLLGIAGLFFGPVPTLIAMAMTAAYRAHIGGAGMLTGIAVIVACGGIGLLWRHYRQAELAHLRLRELLLFGVLVEVAMLLLQFTLPEQRGLVVLPVIIVPVLTVYPIATALLGSLIVKRCRYEQQTEELARSEAHLQSIFTHAPVALWREDWSQVWQALAEIRAQGNQDLATYLETYPGEIWRLASLVRILDVNEAALVQAGAKSRDELFRALDRFFNEASIANFAPQLVHMASGNEFYEGETEFVRLDGEVRRMRLGLFVLPDQESSRNLVIVSTIDITERSLFEHEIQDSYTLLSNLAEQVPGVLYQYQLFPDGRSCFPYASRGLKQIYGVTPAQVREDAGAVFKVIHPDDQNGLSASILASAQTQEPWQHEYRVILPGKGERWLVGAATPQRQADDSTLWYGYIRDVTERKRIELRLELASRVFDAAGEAILVTDEDGRIVAVNPAFTRMTGYTEAEALGQNPRMLNSGRHDAEFYRNLWQTIRSRGEWSGNVWNRRKNGEVYPEWLRISAVNNARGELENYVAVFSDLSEIRQAQSLAERRAREDALTGLSNRAAFIQQLDTTMADVIASGRYATLVLIDIDHFKALNEKSGLMAGDHVLKELSQRLRQLVGNEHFLARVGADEFAILLSQRTETRDDAGRLALALVEQLRMRMRATIKLDDQTVAVANSIGIVVFPDTAQDVAADVLQQADWAIAQAKVRGGDQAVFFQATMGQEIRERYRLEQELRLAVACDQLLVYLQPQFDTQGVQVSAEALIRWQHPQRGLVPPGMFIPLAEASDLIFDIERWMLREVCRLLVKLEARGQALPIALNISAKHFERADFVEEIKRQISLTGVSPSYLVFEITESIVIENLSEVTAKLLELATLGIHFSMDDFGTGYSSLSYLKRLPIHELKIDRSFIMDAPTDPNDAALVQTIIGVARTMGLRIVAEGVETQAQADFLKGCGDVIYQGYLYAKPMPLAQWEAEFLERPI